MYSAHAKSPFTIRRFVEEPVDILVQPPDSPQTVTSFIRPARDSNDSVTPTVLEKRKLISSSNFDHETQHSVALGNPLLGRCLDDFNQQLDENRSLIEQFTMAAKIIAPEHENLDTPPNSILQALKDYTIRNLGHDFAKDIESSSSEEFYDCISRLSTGDADSIAAKSRRIFHGSPDGCFEKSSSFYPEQYTMQGLFSNPIFVFAITQSERYDSTQKYFLTYAETPRKWRRVILTATCTRSYKYSATLGVSASNEIDDVCKTLSEPLRNQLSMILPQLDLYKSVTNLSLSFDENESGQIVGDSIRMNVAKDLLEIEMSNEDRIMRDIEDLGCPQFLESEVIVRSRMSTSCFMVLVESRACTEQQAPFASIKKRGRNAFCDYFEDLKSLYSLRGCNGIAAFIGVVLDDTRQHLRSYLYEYPALGTIWTILVNAQANSDLVPWSIRELWARQVISAVSDIHSRGFVVGRLAVFGIGVRADGTAFLTGINTSERRFMSPGARALQSRNTSNASWDALETNDFRLEIFHLGFFLWMLAEHRTTTTGFFCAISGCTSSPRYMCTAEHASPIELPDCSPGIPNYFGEIIRQCRSSDPKMRPTALSLAKILSCRPYDRPSPASMKDMLGKYARPSTFSVHCDECGTITTETHYHCKICHDADFDLCPACFAQGIHCFDRRHPLMKRIVKNDHITEDGLEWRCGG